MASTLCMEVLPQHEACTQQPEDWLGLLQEGDKGEVAEGVAQRDERVGDGVPAHPDDEEPQPLPQPWAAVAGSSGRS